MVTMSGLPGVVGIPSGEAPDADKAQKFNQVAISPVDEIISSSSIETLDQESEASPTSEDKSVDHALVSYMSDSGNEKRRRISLSSIQEVLNKPPKQNAHFMDYYHKTLQNNWTRFPLIPITAFIGTMLTFRLQHGLPMSSVMASSITGILANSLPPPYREIVFCGSFAGMSGHIDKGGPFSYLSACALGLLVGFVFHLLIGRFNGAGGKLGTIAFVSGSIVACVVKLFDVDVDLWNTSDSWESWTVGLAMGGVAAAGLACTLTVTFMSKSPPMSSTTLASATTGLAAVTLFALLPDDTLSEFEVEILTFFAYTGSFAGMSAVTRVGSRLRVISAGWASGLFLLGLWPLFPGVGGKFGFSAMLSVLLVERLPSCKVDHSHQGKFDHSHQVADQSRPVARHSLLKASALLSADGISEIPDPQVQLDWLDWVPAHCWSIVESFLRHGGSIEAAKSAIQAHYESRIDVSSEALNSALLSFSSFVDVRILLKACQALEVAINPPPVLYWGDNHSGNVAEDATTQFCLWLFQALRSGLDNQISGLKEDELPINVVKPLLLNLDIPVEALNPVVTAVQFSHRIQKRVLSLHKLMQMKAVVEAGAYQ